MLGRWKRRGSRLATARLAVRTHRPWPLQLGLLLLGGLVLIGLAQLVFHYGEQAGRQSMRLDGSVRAAQAQQQVLAQQAADLRQRLQASEQQWRVELTTRENLAKQVVQLQSDNSALREQLAFYESLLTKTDRAPALSLELLRVDSLSPGHYRLRATLVQGQSSQQPFKGEIDFRFVTERGGKRETSQLPAARLALTVSRFTRFEKEVELSADTRLRQVEIRIYAAGETRPRISRSYDVKG